MTDDELQQAFDSALAKWSRTNGAVDGDSASELLRLARYFFWAGSEFGLKAGHAIYSETIGKPQ